MSDAQERPRGAEDHDGPGCQINELFLLLGRPHALALLHLFVQRGAQPLRFGEIQDTLGISPKTLTARLREFAAAGLLARTPYNEIPPRVDYAATDKALKLCPSFESLRAWAAENDLKAEPVAAQQ